jgi:hypothetical protein
MTAFNQGPRGGCCPCPIGYGSGRRGSTERVPNRLGTAWMHGMAEAEMVATRPGLANRYPRELGGSCIPNGKTVGDGKTAWVR